MLAVDFYDEFMDIETYEYESIGQYQSVKSNFLNKLFNKSEESEAGVSNSCFI